MAQSLIELLYTTQPVDDVDTHAAFIKQDRDYVTLIITELNTLVSLHIMLHICHFYI